MTEAFVYKESSPEQLRHLDQVIQLMNWYDAGDIEFGCNGGVVPRFNTNDLFYWGCGDAEDITPDDMGLLNSTASELEAMGKSCYLGVLFAARKRRLRPQGACYPERDLDLCLLLDACGPYREPQLGNPQERPHHKKYGKNEATP